MDVERVGRDSQPVAILYKGRRPAHSCSSPAATCRRPATHPQHLTPALHQVASAGISPCSGWAVRKNCRPCLASACSSAQQLQLAGTPPLQVAPRRPRKAPPRPFCTDPPAGPPKPLRDARGGHGGLSDARSGDTPSHHATQNWEIGRHHIARPKNGKGVVADGGVVCAGVCRRRAKPDLSQVWVGVPGFQVFTSREIREIAGRRWAKRSALHLCC